MSEPPRDEPVDPNTYYPAYQPQHGQSPYVGPQGPAQAPARREVAARIARRPQPGFGIAFAVLGVLFFGFGVTVLVSSFHGGRSSEAALGIVLSFAIAAAGYALLAVRASGPWSAAGVTASALGVPLGISFALSAADASFDTSVNVLLPLSIVAWLASYLVVPGARGHVFYLGASLVELWGFIVYSIDSHALITLGLLPLASVRAQLGGFNSDGVLYGGGGRRYVDYGYSFGAIDFTAVAAMSIILGLAYYAVAYGLTRKGRAGAGVAFALAGAPALVFGLIFAAVNAPQALEGVFVLALSTVVAILGARTGRRFTTWFWTIGVGVGLITILADIIGNHDRVAGIVLIIIGVLAVALAPALAALLREPDETAEPGAPAA